MTVDLSVVIVSWNVRELLGSCLRSLLDDLARAGVQANVWVVDNASSDGTPAMVRETFPEIKLIANDENLGFAAANNLALQSIIRHAPFAMRHSFVWLLNPDTEVLPGATEALLSALNHYTKAAVVGAKLLYPDGSLQHGAFHFPGLTQLAFEFFPLPARLYETPLNGRYPRELYEGQEPFPIDHPLGASMMVRAATIAEVGLLDENFWMYCEEIDWCWRMRKAGWRAYCVPTAKVIHHAGKSSEQIRTKTFVALWRSRLRLYEKHYPAWKRRLARSLVQIGMRYKIRQAQAAHHRGEIDAAELEARLQTYHTVLSL
jgi:hypothetical protein